MKPQIPVSLQRLIRDELESGSTLGGSRSWWQRPVVLAVDLADDAAAALLWRPGGVVGLALFERSAGRWRQAGGGTEDGHPRREILRGRPRAETAGPARILTVEGNSFVRRHGPGPEIPSPGNREWLADSYSVLDPYALVFYTWGVRRELPMAELKNYTAHKDRMLKRDAVGRVAADEKIKV